MAVSLLFNHIFQIFPSPIICYKFDLFWNYIVKGCFCRKHQPYHVYTEQLLFLTHPLDLTSTFCSYVLFSSFYNLASDFFSILPGFLVSWQVVFLFVFGFLCCCHYSSTLLLICQHYFYIFYWFSNFILWIWFFLVFIMFYL